MKEDSLEVYGIWQKPRLSGNIQSTVPSRQSLESSLERIFENRFACVLFPSARSALYSILEFFGLSRLDHVLISDLQSHCVWDVVSRIAGPVLSDSEKVKVEIVNHQWGYVKRASSGWRGPIIEDSCDSLVTTSSCLFPNQGQFEILSLPKIIDSWMGGVAICRSLADAVALRRIRDSRDQRLGRIQAHLRKRGLKGEILAQHYWEGSEALNGYIPDEGLQSIQRGLDSWNRCVEVRKEALERLKAMDFESLLPLSMNERLPSVVPLKPSQRVEAKLAELGYKPLIRNVNSTSGNTSREYKEAILWPIYQKLAPRHM